MSDSDDEGQVPAKRKRLNCATAIHFAIRKYKFEEKVHDPFEHIAAFIQCGQCNKQMHKDCIPYDDNIWQEDYICEKCEASRNRKIVHEYKAHNLPVNILSDYIQTRIDALLERKQKECNYIIKDRVSVRVISSYNTNYKVSSIMCDMFPKFPKTLPYTAKTVMAFQNIDGKDVAIFVMFVQEYSSKCPEPNRSTIHIAYVDSVNFFKPSEIRSNLYMCIINAYLSYCGTLGYEKAHLYSAPPAANEDYLFIQKPESQRTLPESVLVNWYEKCFSEAVNNGDIESFSSLRDYAINNEIEKAEQFGFFEEDWWSTLALDSIKREMIINKCEKASALSESVRRKLNTRWMEESEDSNVYYVKLLNKNIGTVQEL